MVGHELLHSGHVALAADVQAQRHDLHQHGGGLDVRVNDHRNEQEEFQVEERQIGGLVLTAQPCLSFVSVFNGLTLVTYKPCLNKYILYILNIFV